MRGSRNLAFALMLAGVFAGMVALGFASVPLYRSFGEASGYNGTTLRTEAAPTVISTHMVRLRFDADVNPTQVEVHLGEPALRPVLGVDMAVRFFVDPALLQDADMRGIDSITLSYTFFRAAAARPAPDASFEVSAQPAAN